MSKDLVRGGAWANPEQQNPQQHHTQGTAIEGELCLGEHEHHLNTSQLGNKRQCRKCGEYITLSDSTEVELISTVMDRRKLFKLALFATVASVSASVVEEIVSPEVASACTGSEHCVNSGPVPSGPDAYQKYGACCSIWTSFQEEMKAAGVLYLDPGMEVNGVTFKDIAKLWNGRSKLKVKVGKGQPMLTYEWNDAIVGANNWGMAGGKVMFLGSGFKGQNRESSIQLLAHEVGHVLSLHHSGNTSDTLMHTRLIAAKLPTENDYKALRHAWGDPDGSEDIEDVEFSEEEKARADKAVKDHINMYGTSPIENERHLLGMENYDEMMKIAETLNKDVTLESRESLEQTNDRKLEEIQASQEAEKAMQSSIPGRVASGFGIASILYGMLMVGIATLDRVNTLIRVPLLPILTFGKYRLDDGMYDDDGRRDFAKNGSYSLGYMYLVAGAIMLLGIALISGIFFDIFQGVWDFVTFWD